MKLECYQLCESIIAISAKRGACQEESNGGSKKYHKTTPKVTERSFEYLLDFDKTTGWKSMWVDYASLERLSQMRTDLLPNFFMATPTVEITHTQSSRGMSTSRTLSRGSKSVGRKKIEEVPAETRLPPRSATKKPTQKVARPISKPVKQLGSLLDEENMGKRINFETHALCHHCKRIRSICTDLIRCKYSSLKNGIAVPSCITINGATLYNSTFPLLNSLLLVDVNSKYLEECIGVDETGRYKTTKNIKCNRYFCKSCLKQCYDLNPKLIPKNWICPFCQVLAHIRCNPR